MALRIHDDPVGSPWGRPLAGTLDRITVHSQLLEGNALGDPAVRPLYVYRSPGASDAGAGVPSVYVLQGFTGQLDMWFGRSAFEPTFVERLDAMFAAHECPDAVVVLVDAWTSLGGSQFLNSTATGRYLDYLCDEVVPFVDDRYPTVADRDHRGVTGKSSGGYGAMVAPMLRPDVFGALASHAGDALFECCYLPEFPVVARQLRDHFDGSWEQFHSQLAASPRFDYGRFGGPLELWAYACAYSPDPDRPTEPAVPIEVATGRLRDDVWQRWLERDPVRMASVHADALRSLRRVYLDAGRGDEYFLDLGAAAFAAELDRLGVRHTLELFDGGHGGLTYRYPNAIRELVMALA